MSKNINPRQYSDSRQYDLQNDYRSDQEYVLVSKTADNGQKSDQIVINQLDVIILEITFHTIFYKFILFFTLDLGC